MKTAAKVGVSSLAKTARNFVDFELVGADRPGAKQAPSAYYSRYSQNLSPESRRAPTPDIAEHSTGANVGFAGQCGSFAISRGSGPGINPASRLSVSQSQGHNQISPA